MSGCQHGACVRIHPWHHARRDGHRVICEHCNHVHLGAAACHNSERRDHLCGCIGTADTGKVNLCDHTKGDDTMAKESPEEALGFRVSRVTVKETEDGGKSGDATVVGVGFSHAAALIDNIGEGVELKAGDNRQRAVLRSITFKAGKDGKPGTTTLKVTGAAELDDHIGRSVKVKALQMDLPAAR